MAGDNSSAEVRPRRGSGVTVIESAERLLSTEEPEASTTIETAFAGAGIDVRTGHAVWRITPVTAKATICLDLDDGATVDADRLLVAVGRSPIADGLGLAAAGVDIDDSGFIRTDRHLRTTAERVWAVGDVTGRLPFTHAADEMGRVATANALARIPHWTFNAAAFP